MYFEEELVGKLYTPLSFTPFWKWDYFLKCDNLGQILSLSGIQVNPDFESEISIGKLA